MAKLFNLFSKPQDQDSAHANAANLAAELSGYSIEVMPRTASKVRDFGSLLPKGTRVYVAHIDGTPVKDMVETVKRIADEGFSVMPHIPARSIDDRSMLNDLLAQYSDAGARQALVLAGGRAQPRGDFHCSMQLLETDLFDRHGFSRIHVAGHPEGNRDIDVDGTDRNVMQALRWKQAFRNRTDAEMAIVTQFTFDIAPVTAWALRLANEGISLPIHLGMAGPARLQTMIKFAVACGVGPSIRVLQRRALDLANLVLPYEPTDMLAGLAAHRRACAQTSLRQVHLFPLGGIGPTVEYANAHGERATPGIKSGDSS